MDEKLSESAECSTANISLAHLDEKAELMCWRIVGERNAFFGHQQRGDTDLSRDEKFAICTQLLQLKPGLFLARYHQFLSSGDVPCFVNLTDKGNFEIDHYVHELKSGKFDSAARKIAVKNRRYAAMKDLERKGKYFSDVEMRDRDPLLYEQMIGEHMTQSEMNVAFHQGERAPRSDMRLSSMLMEFYEKKEVDMKRFAQQLEEGEEDTISSSKRRRTGNEYDEESDDDDESELDSDNDESMGQKLQHSAVSNDEKARMRQEFVSIMHERFLLGEDQDFDYGEVDDNEVYDCVEQVSVDAEERYFDAEEPDVLDCAHEDAGVADDEFAISRCFKH